MSSKKQCTHNKAQESLRAQMRKLQSETTKLKSMVGYINLIQGLNIRKTMTEEQIKELKDMFKKIFRKHQIMGRCLGKNTHTHTPETYEMSSKETIDEALEILGTRNLMKNS